MSRRPPRPPVATIRTELPVPLRYADGFSTIARVVTFDGLVDGREHIAIGLGDQAGETRRADGLGGDRVGETRRTDGLGVSRRRGAGRRPEACPPTLVRIHSECLTGDVLGSRRCDCGPQLDEAIRRISAVGGYLLYLRQEGRGIGLYAKLDAYALQDAGLDTYEANVSLGYGQDERDYTVAAQMLHALGISRIALLSNNPDKAAQLVRHGVTVAEQVPTGVYLSTANASYLGAKAHRGGHLLNLPTPLRIAAAASPVVNGSLQLVPNSRNPVSESPLGTT